MEDAFRLAAAEHCKCFRVIKRKLLRIDPHAARLLDELNRLGQDREVAQAEEIHLQEAGPLHVAHRPLRDDFRLALHILQRHVLIDRLFGNHDRRRVRADIAREAFDLHRQVDQLVNFAIGVVRLPQLVALLERLLELDAELVGHHRHDLIDAKDRHPQRAANVANRRPRGQRAERADLRDVRLAVFVLYILNHFAAAILAEVDIDIRRLAAVLIQEPLEQQAVVQRAHVADMECIAHQRTNARTAGRTGNVLLARMADKIPHD